jgi:hypothetical protein
MQNFPLLRLKIHTRSLVLLFKYKLKKGKGLTSLFLLAAESTQLPVWIFIALEA